MNNNKKMPVLFIGHGSPMNAIANNEYTQTLNQLGKDLPTPNAILCISAHWMTNETFVTHMSHPKTIHDFYGFPQPLFEVQYRAPGSPKMAELIAKEVESPKIKLDDHSWGFDHGTWSVLKHLYPRAEIPTLQLSMDMTKPAEFHFTLGKKLNFLREHGVLILGSGNIVHNLRAINWETQAPANSLGIDFDNWVKDKIQKKDFHPLIHQHLNTDAGKFSVPTPDHYLPLLYVLGASTEQDEVKFVYTGIQNSSISMTSVLLG
jgi:4,5-DOPA dioxygenase extradiol